MADTTDAQRVHSPRGRPLGLPPEVVSSEQLAVLSAGDAGTPRCAVPTLRHEHECPLRTRLPDDRRGLWAREQPHVPRVAGSMVLPAGFVVEISPGTASPPRAGSTSAEVLL